MFRYLGVSCLSAVLVASVSGMQTADSTDLATFQQRLTRYAEMHRRLEGPLPPLLAAKDMDDVHRLMDALRTRIRTERKGEGQGYLLTPAMVRLFRARVASCLSAQDIVDMMADIDEHTPPNMPPLVVNEALPEDAPFGFVPPQLLSALPPLPPELRYVVMSNALVIWDHHADLIVDIAPDVFDAKTYRKGHTEP